MNDCNQCCRLVSHEQAALCVSRGLVTLCVGCCERALTECRANGISVPQLKETGMSDKNLAIAQAQIREYAAISAQKAAHDLGRRIVRDIQDDLDRLTYPPQVCWSSDPLNEFGFTTSPFSDLPRVSDFKEVHLSRIVIDDPHATSPATALTVLMAADHVHGMVPMSGTVPKPELGSRETVRHSGFPIQALARWK